MFVLVAGLLASGSSFGDKYTKFVFENKIDSAISRISSILSSEKEFGRPMDVSHDYGDKYLLAEYLTNTMISASVQLLEKLGLSGEQMVELRSRIAKDNSSVFLNLTMQLDNEYLGTEKIEIKGPTEIVRESGYLGTYEKETTVSQSVKQYIWRQDTSYMLSIQLSGEDYTFPLRVGSMSVKDVRRVKVEFEDRVIKPASMLDITWLIKRLSGGDSKDPMPQFTIDRSSTDCATPRRNLDIEKAIDQFSRIHNWSKKATHLLGHNFAIASGIEITNFKEDIPSPILPMFDKETCTVPSANDVVMILKDHEDSLNHVIHLISKTLETPNKTKIMKKPNFNDMTTWLVTSHWPTLLEQYMSSLDFIENMLRMQLIKGIGKEISAKDFQQYMRFHLAKQVFKPEYTPKPFTYAVRRPGHSPEGAVSIEYAIGNESDNDLIETFVRETSPRNMSFALNAATKVSFTGSHFIHSFLDHQVENAVKGSTSLKLLARSRQFSSFILVLGTIKSTTEFDAKHALIIKNKDELEIPLILDQIPSAKAFRDYTQSLSPEQQRFAQAYRGMQLEGTVFGMITIQIKPAMEKVLNLKPGTLTKEIQLTQDLMELFIKYQIPTDLLSFSEGLETQYSEGFTAKDRLAQVKKNVKAMLTLVEKQKYKLTEKAKQEKKYREYEEREAQPRRATGPVRSPTSSPEIENILNYVAFNSIKLPTNGLSQKASPRFNMDIDPQEAVAMGAALMGGVLTGEMNEDTILLSDLSFINENSEPVGEGKTILKSEEQGQTDVANNDDNESHAETASDTNNIHSPPVISQEDYTQLPVKLDALLEAKDEEGAVRPSHLTVTDIWSKRSRESILAPFKTTSMGIDEAKREKNLAFDLLDALSRSGGIALGGSNLHVIVAATHCFDKTLMDTVIQDNVNPIEKIEKSALLMSVEAHRLGGVRQAVRNEIVMKRLEETQPVWLWEEHK